MQHSPSTTETKTEDSPLPCKGGLDKAEAAFVGQMARVSERNSGAPERAQEHSQGQASNASAAPVKDKKEMEPREPAATEKRGFMFLVSSTY